MTESGRHGRARSTLRAVIFDFNGVLVDDERLHAAAAAEVLAREEGIALPEADYFDRYFGLDDRALFAAALRDAGRGGDSAAAPGPDRIAALVARKAAVYLEALEGGVQLLPGARRLVERLAAAALPLAMSSAVLSW